MTSMCKNFRLKTTAHHVDRLLLVCVNYCLILCDFNIQLIDNINNFLSTIVEIYSLFNPTNALSIDMRCYNSYILINIGKESV